MIQSILMKLVVKRFLSTYILLWLSSMYPIVPYITKQFVKLIHLNGAPIDAKKNIH